MKKGSSTKIFSWYYLIVITIVIIVGVFSSVVTFLGISKTTRETLLKNTASIASIFDTSDIASFTGTKDDLKNPAYISLKNKLEKIPGIDSRIRFVYLWTYHDGKIYFLVDSEPSTSPDYSPPGQIYTEATEIDKDVFLKKLSGAMEMNTDRWGTWLSALTPIKDPVTGNLLAVMGVDMNARDYSRMVNVTTSIPVLTTIFVLTLIIIGLVLRKREQEFLAFKSELVSIASHEIRSPLTGITWIMDEFLDNGSNMSEKQKYDINMVKTKSQQLLATINDLLDGAVAEKISKKNLTKKPIQMEKLFNEIVQDSSMILAEKNIQLNISDTLTPKTVIMGDQDRIKRMFNNLISNALKYSKNGGKVLISVIDKDKSLIFSIKDEGIGISPKDQSKIFRGFFRTENAKKITSNGTGLGLHYVRQIAELHNGKVWCESEEEKGSTFFVELPKMS